MSFTMIYNANVLMYEMKGVIVYIAIKKPMIVKFVHDTNICSDPTNISETFTYVQITKQKTLSRKPLRRCWSCFSQSARQWFPGRTDTYCMCLLEPVEVDESRKAQIHAVSRFSTPSTPPLVFGSPLSNFGSISSNIRSPFLSA